MTEGKPDYDNIRRLEHETDPTADLRLQHMNDDGTSPECCKYWVKTFTENLPDPLWEPNAQTGKMPWE